MLWEISGKQIKSPSYLFGTFHTRDPIINKLPTIVTSSLEQTQRLYTEIPMTNKSTGQILRFSKITHPTPLKHRLHPKTIKFLLKNLKEKELPYTLQTLKAYKTWAIALMLANNEEESKYPHSEFMDEVLVSYAKKKHIKQSALETPIEQLSFFDALPTILQEQLLLDTFNLQTNTAYTEALKAWYLKGESKGFSILQKHFSSSNPRQEKLDNTLNKGLLIERNARFTRRIDILLKHNTILSYFFALGAGHMSGKNGIVQGLKDLGYTIKKID